MPFDVSAAGDSPVGPRSISERDDGRREHDGLHLLARSSLPILPPLLPSPLTSFVGRERAIAEITELLLEGRARLVTVTGPGGIGKTRLSLEVARAISGRNEIPVAFIPLSSLLAPSRLLAMVVAGSGVPDVPSDPTPRQFADAIGARPFLLVLDNLEQLEEATPVLSWLLSACPGLAILCATRRRLRLSGEHVFPLGGLALPDAQVTDAEIIRAAPAVRLFIERANAVAPGLTWDSDELAASAAICRLVEGEPLAIELAASRVALLPPQVLRDRMERLLPTLGSGPGDVEPRLRTMRHAIQWSYDLLTPNAQRVLRQLSVFIGGCTLQDAEAVLPGPETELLDTLEQLAELSLIRSVAAGAGGYRFVLPPPVWEFANELLKQSGEEADLRNAHAAHIAAQITREEPYWNAANLARISEPDSGNWPNVRAAFEWLIESGQGEAALELTWGVVDLAWFRLFGAEIHEWMQRAYILTEGSPPSPIRTRVTSWIGLLASVRGDDEMAWQFVNAAVEMAVLQGDTSLTSFTFRHGGQVARGAGHMDEAVEWHRRAYETAATADPRAFASANYEYGASLMAAGRLHEARELIAASFEIAERASIQFIVALCDLGFARLALFEGRIDDACGHLDKLLDGRLDREDLSIFAETLLRSAATGIAVGAYRTAALLHGAAQSLLGQTIRLRFRDQPLADDVTRQLADVLAADELQLLLAAGAHLQPDAMIAEATRLIRRQAEAPPASHGSDPLDVLSPREREVLAQLVAGKTDREIAETLFISRSTASRHVEAILRKLNVPTRTAAAVFATRSDPNQL